MSIIELEIEARERAATSAVSFTMAPRSLQKKFPHTASALFSGQVNCSYCNQSHPSESCTKVTHVKTRQRETISVLRRVETVSLVVRAMDDTTLVYVNDNL